MKPTLREPHAPSAALPELDEFLRPFHPHFGRSEGRQSLERYLTGLLTEHNNKNCDTIAQVVPGTSQQRLHNLLTDLVWDHDDLNDQRVRTMLRLPSEGDAVLVFDDTGFAKQGQCSVGVQRQYSGTLGKTGNCQVTVNCHYAERTLGWPVSTRLYLPEVWANNLDRREKAGVPEEIRFQTKPDIALDLLDHARSLGVRCACVTADADYGDNPNFLNGLELRRQQYVVAIRCDLEVTLGQTAAEQPQRVDALVESLPARSWRTIRWREGSQGWQSGRFCAVRCWRVLKGGRRRLGWLIGEDGSDGKRRYYWSKFGRRVPLERMVEYAHRRYWVEQFHEEAKGLLGWDQYQGRLWTGFHRNSVLVLLAYSFLVWQEYQHRQRTRRRGRPRRPFSPSAGPAAATAAGGASACSRLAAA
jgi:SRSO17 transposase